jgi:hypothetical protein
MSAFGKLLQNVAIHPLAQTESKKGSAAMKTCITAITLEQLNVLQLPLVLCDGIYS